MKTFTLSLDLTGDQLVKFLSKLPDDVKFRIDMRGDPSPDATAKPKRVARGSKVERAIRETLAGNRRATTAVLKGDMVNAGLKPSSLGSTLSKMQRARQVRRDEDGCWSLTQQMAAQ